MEHPDYLARPAWICIDRSVIPTYPRWIEGAMHPELENSGPNEYDLESIELWRHTGQNEGVVAGYRIYEDLRKTDSFKSCLGLHDATEIHKRGITVFTKIFGDNIVYFWRSVVRDCSGGLHVLCLYERDGILGSRWEWLDLGWNDDRPAAQFAK